MTFLIVKSFVLYGNERRIKKNPIIFHAISFILTTFLLRSRCIHPRTYLRCTSSDYIIPSHRHCCYRLSNINSTFPHNMFFLLSFSVTNCINTGITNEQINQLYIHSMDENDFPVLMFCPVLHCTYAAYNTSTRFFVCLDTKCVYRNV